MNQIPWLHFSEAWYAASLLAESATLPLHRIGVLLTHIYKPSMPWKSQNCMTTEKLKLQLLRNIILNPYLDSEHPFFQLLIHHGFASSSSTFHFVAFISNLLPEQKISGKVLLIPNPREWPVFYILPVVLSIIGCSRFIPHSISGSLFW